jgi:hypothetical protein
VYSGINDGPKIRSNYVPKISNALIRRYAEKCAEKEEKYLKSAVEHKCNVVFKLILPPEVSLQRKPEENIELVRKKHEIIKTLDFGSAECYTIDATMPYDDEIKMIKRIIWQKIQ